MNAKMSDFKRLLHLYLFLFRNAVNRTNIKNLTIILEIAKKVLPFYPNWNIYNNRRLVKKEAQLRECRSAKREVAGSNPSRTNTQGLKITEEKVLPSQWLRFDFLGFSDKDEKP